MWKAIRYLFQPKRLLEAIRTHQVKITGFLGLLFALVLTLMTALPVLGILLGKLIGEDGLSGQTLRRAFVLSGALLLAVPMLKWWGFGLFLRFSLGRGERDTPLPSFATLLLARSLGLLPILFLLPLKVILLPPKEILSHFFFPPIAAIFTTLAYSILPFQGASFLLLTTPSPYTRPSFAISLVFWLLTFWFTYRKLTQLTECSRAFLFKRALLATLLWEIFSFCLVLFVFHPRAW